MFSSIPWFRPKPKFGMRSLVTTVHPLIKGTVYMIVQHREYKKLSNDDTCTWYYSGIFLKIQQGEIEYVTTVLNKREDSMAMISNVTFTI